jgi:hypothetical protein
MHENAPLIPPINPPPPKPPEVDVSLSIVESAERMISPKPDGEAESEAEFEKNLEAACTP